MIRINLLPHREAERKRRRDRFHRAVGGALASGALLAGLLYASLTARMADQVQRNELLSEGIRHLEGQIRDIATISRDIQALRARERAVQQLQTDRNLPVALLGELAAFLPDGAFLTSVRQEDATILVTGVADSNERVSEFMRRLAQDGRHMGRPELVEVVAGSLPLGPRDSRRVANFTLRVLLSRPVQAPAAAPLVPASLPPPASAGSRP